MTVFVGIAKIRRGGKNDVDGLLRGQVRKGIQQEVDAAGNNRSGHGGAHHIAVTVNHSRVNRVVGGTSGSGNAPAFGAAAGVGV